MVKPFPPERPITLSDKFVALAKSRTESLTHGQRISWPCFAFVENGNSFSKAVSASYAVFNYMAALLNPRLRQIEVPASRKDMLNEPEEIKAIRAITGNVSGFLYDNPSMLVYNSENHFFDPRELFASLDDQSFFLRVGTSLQNRNRERIYYYAIIEADSKMTGISVWQFLSTFSETKETLDEDTRKAAPSMIISANDL